MSYVAQIGDFMSGDFMTWIPLADTTKSKKKDSVADDLRKIEGIGPKIAEILSTAGIDTFASLASSDPEKLREVLLEEKPDDSFVAAPCRQLERRPACSISDMEVGVLVGQEVGLEPTLPPTARAGHHHRTLAQLVLDDFAHVLSDFLSRGDRRAGPGFEAITEGI